MCMTKTNKDTKKEFISISGYAQKNYFTIRVFYFTLNVLEKSILLKHDFPAIMKILYLRGRRTGKMIIRLCLHPFVFSGLPRIVLPMVPSNVNATA